MELFGASSLEEGAYQHGYNCIAKLHSLNELEKVEKSVYELLAFANDQKACETIMKTLISELELRLKVILIHGKLYMNLLKIGLILQVVQQSIKITEPILCLRRVAIDQAKSIVRNKSAHSVPLLDSLLGETWLLSAKGARIAGVTIFI